MKISLATTESDFEQVNIFFGNIWKEEFDLDRFDRIEEYRNGIVILMKREKQIIGAISLTKYNKKWLVGRFGVEKYSRGKGLGKILFLEMEKEIINKNIKSIEVFAEISRVPMYEKFGFSKIGKLQKIGNTQSLMMKKNYN